MAEFEGELAPALERVIAAGNMRYDDDRAMILNFLCMLATRTPRWRETMRDFTERVSKQIMNLALATPERWERQVKQATAAGHMKEHEVTYEEMKDFDARGEYKMTVKNNYHIAMEFGNFDDILRTFFARNWVVLHASETSGGFITCDHPLGLFWTDPKMRGGFFPPGLGVAGTEVILPLSPRVALVGAFELQDGELNIPDRHVAALNAGVAANAEWHVYARDSNFMFWTGKHSQPRKASKLLDDEVFRRPRPER